MPSEPNPKRVIAYIDGQNLWRCAKNAYGNTSPYTYPSYDIRKLCMAICLQNGWNLFQIKFYTGVPNSDENPFWHNFWTKKLAQMGRLGVKTFSRPLKYDDGGRGREKGIDVRIAIDIIRDAHKSLYDIALIFSQDQDLSEAATEIRQISVEQNRWIKAASAFPVGPNCTNNRGINKTDWLQIDKSLYDSCLDPRDYR